MNGRIRSIGWVSWLAIGLAVLVSSTPAFAQISLSQGNPVTVSTSPTNYSMTIEQGYWNVVGVTPNDVSSNWDISHPPANGTLPLPWCDYVLANGNNGTITGASGSVSRVSGTGSTELTHAAHGPILNAGGSDTITWTTSSTIYFWEVNLASAGTYDFNVTGPSVLYYDIWTPGTGAGWIDSAMPWIFQNVGTPTTGLSLSAGWHLLVVYRNAGPGVSGTVSVSVTGAAAPTLVAQSVSVPGAPINVPVGGTFQVTRSIENTGSSAASTPYAIYLSTNNIISTGDIQVYSATTAVINPGVTNTISVTCTAPGTAGGPYYVGVHITDTNTAVTANADVTVISGGGMIAQSVTVPGAPITVAPGQTFQVTRSIQNAGSASASTPYTIYLSTNTIISTADIAVYSGTTATIGPGVTNTITVNCTAPGTSGGPYYVGVYISASNNTRTANADVTVAVVTPAGEVDSALGCSGAGGGGGGVAALLPLLLLTAGCFWLRRRKLGSLAP
ncbi:MAG: hypothetical protein ACYTHM_12165 [Planctomycetota bacterium]